MNRMRNTGLDLLKILACVGVVALHTTMGGFSNSESWNMSAYLYYLGTYSIPLFFMINGYFLLRKSEITYTYIISKLKPIILSVIAWNLIVWLLKRDFSENPIKKIVGSLVQRGYFFQFWFFGALIIIYLTLPFLKKYLNSRERYIHLLIVLAIIGLGFEIANIIFKAAFQGLIIQSFRLWTWYFYYILGGFIASINIKNVQWISRSSWKIAIGGMFFISPIFLFIVAKYSHHNLYAEFFYDTLIVKIITTGIFLVFLHINLKEIWNRWIITLSSLIMGVFIIHPYVMKVWEKIVGLDFKWSHILYFIAVLLLSFIGTAIIVKIPFLNRIINL